MSRYTILSSCEGKRDVYTTGKTYEDKAMRLARSIRAVDKDVPIVMWYGEDRPPSDGTAVALADLDCFLSPGPCRFPRVPLFNKVTALCRAPVSTPYRLWIDTDVYVKGGLGYFETLAADAAAAADTRAGHALTKTTDRPIWDRFYALTGIPADQHRLGRTSIDGGEGNFHCNTGVVWMKNDPALLAEYERLSALVLRSGIPYGADYFDAIALILLVLSCDLSYEVLPERLNYFYALRQNTDGDLVHYQDNVLDHHEGIAW